MGTRHEVIVVGAGHAGVEAAWAAANLLGHAGAKPGAVALVTLRRDTIGVMSCNPAIGGLAKGQLVREIDALGGLMGLAADATGIHFKMLNTSKGPAVHGPRAQCDRHAYAEEVARLIASRPEIEVIEAAVESIEVDRAGVAGVTIARGGTIERLEARAVVVTTGTFMRGLMHTGESRTPGGRHGEAPSTGIAASLRALGFEMGRLKTGTPPRLHRESLDWDALEVQPGDERPMPFSELSGEGFPVLEQVACRQTRTTPAIHDLIRANIHRAPMFSGQIESVGPRYCPSIEDKVVRFADRQSHGVFLEPESHRDDIVYCNGIATSLPIDVQERIVHGLPGCERARIARFGYAVEYDMVRPHQIAASGMTKRVEGLFLAGQINGTSGYEEAAAQGVVAGINAARFVRGEGEFVLGRHEAYIGVLMDDLVTKTPTEPYRMFTSRAEHRLLLRADNAADRLTPIADELGLLASERGRARRDAFAARSRCLRAIDDAIAQRDIDGRPMAEMIYTQGFDPDRLRASLPDIHADERVFLTAFANRAYEPYLRRQEAEIRRQQRMESRRLPGDLAALNLSAMRAEARQALVRFTPATFGQASRLEGITPADLTLLAVVLDRRREPRSA